MTTHYYVFVRKNGVLYYERTCGSEHGARRRVAELGSAAFYFDKLPGDRWFY